MVCALGQEPLGTALSAVRPLKIFSVPHLNGVFLLQSLRVLFQAADAVFQRLGLVRQLMGGNPRWCLDDGLLPRLADMRD